MAPSLSTLRASVLEVKGNFHERVEVRTVHAGTCAPGAEGLAQQAQRGLGFELLL